MSRLKNKKSSLPDAFDSESHKTEWTCAAKMAGWINEIAKEKNIPIGAAEVETKTKESGKRSDIIIYETPKNLKALCVIECKQPFWDVFNEELKEDARNKGNKRKAPYFATCNFKKLIWWNTERANNPVLTEEQQILEKYNLSEIENLDEIENIRYREPIRKELEKFIFKLFLVHTGKEPEPKQAIDEHLIDRIHEKIRVLSHFYTDIIRDKFHTDVKFATSLKSWFDEQMWEFSGRKNDFDKAARQTAYLLVNKILFYDVLQSKQPKELDPLKIPDSLTKGSMLQKTLQMYFDEVLKIDYETLYTTDFIDIIAFPEDDDLVKQIKDLVSILNRYNFGTLGYDILGRIFERLIPQDERHTLGQYFTSADIVDLILQFCSQNENDKLLDPSCGAGTFLVRGYQQKKLMNQHKKHEEILDKLWGNDIAKFPVHLSTINLAINDLGVMKNYPNILQSDFFALQVGPHGFDNENWRKRRAKTLGLDEREVTYPRYFDAIVGNPPYTRQEEIGDTGVDKRLLIANAVMFGNKKLADISEQAGIHAYFFVHGTKFLKDGGYFGFIVSNSWLDVDYGKGLQEFFLLNYKIVAIIESKEERWFIDADVNTCIVILQKCSDEKERMNNFVRFVLLKKSLRFFIPATENIWHKQIDRKDAIDKLIYTILAHSKYYENDDLRVFALSQQELWEEGFDIIHEENDDVQNKLKESQTPYGKYIGSKWGKYLRAPESYYKILRKSKEYLIPLRKVAEIKAGCYTGINEFFYFDKKPAFKDRIEKEYLKKIIRNTHEITSINIDSSKLKSEVFVCQKSKSDLEKKNQHGALGYIKWGEKQTGRTRQKRKTEVLFPSIESVKNRKPGWWAIPSQNLVTVKLFMLYVINKRFIVPYSENAIISDRCFHRIIPFDTKNTKILGAILNSTFTIYFIELDGRSNLGLGALKFEATDAKKIFIINCNSIEKKTRKKLLISFNKLKNRKVESIFDEIGAKLSTEVSLTKVKPDRRELDKIIMSDILGLTDDEQLEVYSAVIDLVKSRIEKAHSVEKNNKIIEGIDIKSARNEAIAELKKRKK
jgi:tRNA G10  N-methylase Trm11